MELETLIAEERPFVKKLSRGFARRREALMSPEDLEQEGYLFLCKFYERIQKKHLGSEAIKALSYQSLKNFYISLYRKFTRKKRMAEIVSLDFPIPAPGDPLKSLIFQEHLESLRKTFKGLEKEVFEILVGENGNFLRDMGNLWRGNGYPSIKIRQSEMADWLAVPQPRITNAIAVLKEKVASEFHYKKNRKDGRDELGVDCPNLRVTEHMLSHSSKTKELVMFGVPEEEDCFGKMYDEAVSDCTDGRCEQWRECKELTEEKAMSSKKQKKEKQKKRQFAARTTEKREEQKEKKAEFKEKIDRKIVNPWQPGSGRAYAFDLLVEGGTKNQLVDRLEKIVKEKGLRFDPKKRITRTLQDYRFEIDEKCKPYQLLEDGEGGWKTFRVVKRDTSSDEDRKDEEQIEEKVEEKETEQEIIEEQEVKEEKVEEEKVEEEKVEEQVEEEEEIEEEITENQGVKVSEEYRDLVPRLSSEDFARLEDSIKREGVRDPIVINPEGIILDGYTRFEIATAQGLKFETVERSFADKFEEKEFVIKANLERRHLTSGQRSILGLKLEEIEAEKAKERQGTRTDIEQNNIRPDLPRSSMGRARDKAAKVVGVSGSTLDKAKKIQKEGTPEQREKLVNGKSSVDKLYREVTGKKGKKSQPAKEQFSIILNLRRKNEILIICGKESTLLNMEEGVVMFSVSKAQKLEKAEKIEKKIKKLYPSGKYLELFPTEEVKGLGTF